MTKQFRVINPNTKDLFDEAFATKEEVRDLIVKSRMHDLKITSNRQINALIKSRNLKLNIKPISDLRLIAERQERQENERIAELKRRGLFNKVGLW